ncbi:glycosyltransferase family 4 protein [Escherichia albertii]|nr:glycosyltransferase family 4 protein [Escherichia albertii]MCZ8858278.1 glycosyltransferase family 4 protein [Escherichia albertii]MCZ8884736.1 glycosyltransferase family 4 protein [Escherichia albertii]WDC03765.1 glycosyltransferase family 4 protein [Escherichia albertii]
MIKIVMGECLFFYSHEKIAGETHKVERIYSKEKNMIVFFIGPSSGKITGQSLAFNIIFKAYSGDKYLVDYPDFSDRKIRIFCKYFKLFFVFFVRMLKHIFERKIIYITTSRTLFGFIRDLYFVILGKLFFAKVVNHLHGSDFVYFRDNQGKVIQKIIDFVYSRIDTSIVLTEGMREQYKQYQKMKVFVVSNCYYRLSKFDLKLCLVKSELRLVYLSNLMYSKGIIHLIRAVKRCFKNGMKLNLKIAGSICSDEYCSEYELKTLFFEEIKECSYIQYLGPVQGEEKNNLLLESDIFILPTFYRSEAQPISIIEAMYYGCVIITTGHNYVKELVGEKNGVIIDKDSQQAIADALMLIDVAREYYKKVSEYNIHFANTYYSPNVYIEKISKIINEV